MEKQFDHRDHEYYAKTIGIDYATYYEIMIGLVDPDDYQDVLTLLDNQSEPAIIGT